MTRKQKAIAGLLTALIAIGIYFGYYRFYDFAEPANWKDVHIGLDRSEIHRLAGPPDTDSYDIKSLDRWHKRTHEGYWTLDVVYPDLTATNRCDHLFVNLVNVAGRRLIRHELSPELTNRMHRTPR